MFLKLFILLAYLPFLCRLNLNRVYYNLQLYFGEWDLILMNYILRNTSFISKVKVATKFCYGQ